MNLNTRGFTLVEMAVTILVLGLLLGFSVPAFQRISTTYQLKGATENIAAQIRLSREKAIATGTGQPWHFATNFLNSDYHIHYPSGHAIPLGKLPRGVTLYSVFNPILWQDGKVYSVPPPFGVPTSGLIILRDDRGNRDTISVQASGLVLTK